MDTSSIFKKFEWQNKGNTNIKDLVIAVTSPMVFAFNEAGSPFIKLVHPAGKFGRDPFNPAEYQGKVIYFVGDRIHGVNPVVILVEDDVWKWTKAKVMKEVVRLATFYGDASNRGLMYTPKYDDVKVDVETPMVGHHNHEWST